MIELMITLTIGAILLALAVPQMREYIARTRVSGTATELAADIRLARSMVQQQNQPIWINFGSTDDFTCYVLYTEGDGVGYCYCDRSPNDMCDASASPPVPLRSVFIKRNTGITLASTTADIGYAQAIGAPRVLGGTAEVEISSNLGGRLKVKMNGLTRATICSVSGHTAEFGDCP